jgi:hypothetical protein
MALTSITLFFQGRLFADPGKVYQQIALGALVTIIVLIGAAKFGAPLWAATSMAGFVGGALQPYLFKNLRYR